MKQHDMLHPVVPGAAQCCIVSLVCICIKMHRNVVYMHCFYITYLALQSISTPHSRSRHHHAGILLASVLKLRTREPLDGTLDAVFAVCSTRSACRARPSPASSLREYREYRAQLKRLKQKRLSREPQQVSSKRVVNRCELEHEQRQVINHYEESQSSWV